MTFLSDRGVARLRLALEAPDPEGERYQVLEELGRGGMGRVYRARDRVLDREVALKVLDLAHATPEGVERMRREARILARLEHPGIVPVHDVGLMPDGRVYYTMKRVRGARLDGHAEALGRAERLRLFIRLCEAVAFAHAQGVIHRDLKPENVMVGPFGEVLVMDWGVARLGEVVHEGAGDHDLEAARDDAHVMKEATTRSGTVIGTPGYMAPEQALGRTDVIDGRADVFGLGAILHFLLTGRAPGGRGPGEARAEGPRAIDRSVPRSLDAICLRALAPAPEARYASATDLGADVTRFLDGRRVLAHRENALERALRFGRMYRTAILLIAAYLVMRALFMIFSRG